MLDWALVTGLSCIKGVWYIYGWDTGQVILMYGGVPTGFFLVFFTR